MEIYLRTEEILVKLRENKEKHILEYAEQVKGWKEAMTLWSVEMGVWRDSASESIADVIEVKRPVEPQKPSIYVDTYDRYIELLEAHVLDTVLVGEHEFDELVKDEFRWQTQFRLNSNTYSK